MANGMTNICIVKESKYRETLVDTIPNEYIFCYNSFYLPCQPPQVQCIFIRLIQLLYCVLFPGTRKDCTNEISLYSTKIPDKATKLATHSFVRIYLSSVLKDAFAPLYKTF